MPPPKRLLHAAAAQSSTPPDSLPEHHAIAQVIRGAGNNLFEARFPASATATTTATATGSDSADSTARESTTGSTDAALTTGLVEMPARFRKAIWVRNGGFVVVDRAALNGARRNKLAGEIVNVVRGVDGWRRMPYWPKEFSKQTGDFDNGDDSGDESSDAEDDGRGGQGKNVGEMPPSESDDDDEGDDNEDDGKHAAHDSWRAARAEVVYKTADEEPRRSKR